MRSLGLLFVALLALPTAAGAWNRGEVEVFAVLPAGASGPEGLEVGPDGTVYVTTFGFTSAGAAAGEGQLYVFDAGGRLLRQLSISGSSPHLLGVRYQKGGSLLIIDDAGNLWVAANQADEIVVVDGTGKAIAKLGDFDGVRGGMPVHMLFPASLRFHGDDLLVTNLSLNTHLFGFDTVDTDWSAQVSRYTVVKIRARIREADED